MMKTLVIVQCRFGSKRLPAKAAYPLCGIPIIAFLLRRLREGLRSKKFLTILATTTNPEDDILAAWGKEEGVEVIRGQDEDVLGRYIQYLKRFPSDTIVRVTGDNPLICPEHLKWLVSERYKYHADYVECRNLPYGSFVDVYSSDLLMRLDTETTDPEEREHINLFVHRNKKMFQVCFLEVKGKFDRPDLRMTVDTKEDWKNLNDIFSKEDNEPWRIALEEVIKRMDSRSV